MWAAAAALAAQMVAAEQERQARRLAYGLTDINSIRRNQPKPDYTPVCQTIDWKADTAAALRQAKVGMAILLALVLSIGWAVWSWL